MAAFAEELETREGQLREASIYHPIRDAAAGARLNGFEGSTRSRSPVQSFLGRGTQRLRHSVNVRFQEPQTSSVVDRVLEESGVPHSRREDPQSLGQLWNANPHLRGAKYDTRDPYSFEMSSAGSGGSTPRDALAA